MQVAALFRLERGSHELAHVRLLGEERISRDRADQEPLTDLLTVFFGLGIFAANAARDFSQSSSGWQAQRLGYLTEQMFGYGLGCWATLRAESDPPWAKYLGTNPRTYMKHGLRYLRQNSPKVTHSVSAFPPGCIWGNARVWTRALEVDLVDAA